MLDNDEDRTSLEKIYIEYKQDMVICALRITGNTDIADDAVHNAFLSIIKHKKTLNW